MKMIENALNVMKPWFDDPETQGGAEMCLRGAAHAGYLRTSQNPRTRAKGDGVLTEMSEALLIPRSVLETYADGMAALHTRAGYEWLAGKIGGKHDE